jgi:hypothetical protein
MSNLEEITYDEINDKIVLILCANLGTTYNQYTLYDAVVDKFSRTSKSIHPDFKYKFIHVLKQLMSNNYGITVLKENDIYYVGYDAQPIIEPCLTNTEWIDKNNYIKYVVENNLENEFLTQDLETGNTIYHELFSNGEYSTIKKVIETHSVDYNIKNNKKDTPIDCINRIEVATLVISDLNKKIDSLEKRLAKLETKDYFDECSIYDFLLLKFKRFIKKNYLTICLLIFMIIIFKLTFIIFL